MNATAIAIVGLGVVHGINPGMGWLFAVSLGLQERERRAVWRALLPLAAGHALAIAGAVTVGLALGEVVPVGALRWVVAAVLVGFGLERVFRGRHPRWVGMRVSGRDLTVWSLMMASAHGAGLMVVPLVLGRVGASMGHAGHLEAGLGLPFDGLIATVLHTVGYLATTGVVAVVVYEKLGLRLLRRYWVNLDLVWGLALIVTGLITPAL